MSKYIVTPWQHQADLLQVRAQLYRLEGHDADHRRHAVDRVMAWKLRGNLPHAVESTALLIDAILHHDTTASDNKSIFSVRAVYSAAFTRFVTGFCDIGRNRERSLEPSSMLDIARQIDMPVEFVALRHEATHEELPGIQRLLKATDDALRWLWNVYWSRLEEPETAETVAAALPAVKAEARRILRSYRATRLEMLRAGKKEVSFQDIEMSAITRSCLEAMRSSKLKTETFASVLVDDSLLWPSKRELGSSLDGAYLIWDAWLQHICSAQRHFYRALVHVMLDSIETRNSAKDEHNPEQEALCSWLLRFLDHPSWSTTNGSARQVTRKEVISWCCLHPGYWPHRVGNQLLESEDATFQEIWRDVLDASKLVPVSSKGNSETVAAMEDVQESLAVDSSPANGGPDNTSPGWVRALYPPSHPIGVV